MGALMMRYQDSQWSSALDLSISFKSTRENFPKRAHQRHGAHLHKPIRTHREAPLLILITKTRFNTGEICQVEVRPPKSLAHPACPCCHRAVPIANG